MFCCQPLTKLKGCYDWYSTMSQIVRNYTQICSKYQGERLWVGWRYLLTANFHCQGHKNIFSKIAFLSLNDMLKSFFNKWPVCNARCKVGMHLFIDKKMQMIFLHLLCT